MTVNIVTLMTTHRLAPGRDLTLVFENPLAACNPPQREHAFSRQLANARR
ncbi:hypothetical protein [Paraburkholderia sp. GAS334]